MGATSFWGTDGQYKYLHRWIKNQCGKANRCNQADDSCKGLFEWANKSGSYLKDVSDWEQLCRSHHRRYDKAAHTHAILQPKTHCARGHEFTSDNTQIADTGYGRIAKRCITCRKTQLRAQYLKRKASLCSSV